MDNKLHLDLNWVRREAVIFSVLCPSAEKTYNGSQRAHVRLLKFKFEGIKGLN